MPVAALTVELPLADAVERVVWSLPEIEVMAVRRDGSEIDTDPALGAGPP